MLAAIRRASSLINRALTARPSNPASQIETVKNSRPWYSPHRGDAGLSRRMRALCDMPLFNDQQWHDRAAEMRALAERMSNINTKRIMLRLAEDYDKFSNHAAEPAGGRRAWVSPSIRVIRRPSGNLLSAIARRPKPSRPAENIDD